MNTYLKVRWRHDFPEDPVLLYSELDSKRYEVRKVEVFGNGSKGYADATSSLKDAQLGDVPVPELSEIAADAQFEPEEISKAEFEKVWKQAHQ